MITVEYMEQGDQFWIKTKGHAEPIVCAGISVLLQAISARMEELTGKTVALKNGENIVHGWGADEMALAWMFLAGVRRLRDAGAPIELYEEHL